MTEEQSPRRIIIRLPEVKRRVKKSPVQIWRDVRAGKFPAPVRIGDNAIGWFEDEIDEWLSMRPRVKYAGKPVPEETVPAAR